MGKYFKFWLPLILIVVSIVLVVALVRYKKSQRAERKPDTTQAILVDTITAEVTSVNLIVTSQGTVKPRTETSLVAEVSGKIVSVSKDFIAGGFFHKGEVLLQIDPSDYHAGLKRAKAALASRVAKLADETARSEQALKDWRNLGKQGKPSDLGLHKPQLADAKANVSAAEADVEKARRDLERTQISVPYDGLVRKKAVDIGQYVSLGTLLGVTFAIDTAEVRLPLTSTDLNYLELPSGTQTGNNNRSYPAVTLSTQYASGRNQWQAKIIRTEGVVDEISRVVYAVAEIKDPYAMLGGVTGDVTGDVTVQGPQKELKIGTFVKAEIQGLSADNVVVLPRSVLQPDNTVLIVDDDNRLEILPVVVLRAEPKKVYLSSGIVAGAQVITTTLGAPLPGAKLTIAGAETEVVPTSTNGNEP